MVNILALDSSSDACSVALYCDGKTNHLFEMAVKSHTQRLLPMVDEILRQAHCELSALNAIAYGCGPGSFTGLRICMGVVQGLAFGANLPVIPVSTLRAMACGFSQEHVSNDLPVLVALDARMDEVYWGLYTSGVRPQAIDREQVMKPALMREQPKIAELQKNFIALGSGWHYEDLKEISPATLILDAYPNAKYIATLAAETFKNGGQISVLDADLVYLRDSISWQKRQRIRTAPI